MATFSTSHTCHMWRISDFSTSVMWRHLKFLHMWKNFQFPHNCHTWRAEIFPHDNCFSTNNISDISDKYQVWIGLNVKRVQKYSSFKGIKHMKSTFFTTYIHIFTTYTFQLTVALFYMEKYLSRKASSGAALRILTIFKILTFIVQCL